MLWRLFDFTGSDAFFFESILSLSLVSFIYMSLTTTEDFVFSLFTEFPMDSIMGRFPSPSAVITDKWEGMFLIMDDFLVGMSSEVFLACILVPRLLLLFYN